MMDYLNKIKAIKLHFNSAFSGCTIFFPSLLFRAVPSLPTTYAESRQTAASYKHLAHWYYVSNLQEHLPNLAI